VASLYPTSNLFMPGHRIRLDVSSSNFPRFDVNPNQGRPDVTVLYNPRPPADMRP
jgi:predicted acyl esterase